MKKIFSFKWCDICVISACYTAETITYANRRDQETQKSLALQDYNCHKAGIDLVDQHLSYGSFNHWSIKWWQKFAL